jgi:hypothetical protein
MVKGETKMASGKEYPYKSAELVPVQTSTEVSVLLPSSGFIGTFLEETHNMFKARAMRMNGLLRRINESGQRAEDLLRTAAQKMEAAEARIRADLIKEGLLPETHSDME